MALPAAAADMTSEVVHQAAVAFAPPVRSWCCSCVWWCPLYCHGSGGAGEGRGGAYVSVFARPHMHTCTTLNSLVPSLATLIHTDPTPHPPVPHAHCAPFEV